MIRHLTTLVLCGILGSMVLVGNAEACHKKRCGCTPVVCAVPKPVPCVTYAPACARRSSTAASSSNYRPSVTRSQFARPPLPTAPAPLPAYPTATPQTSAQH